MLNIIVKDLEIYKELDKRAMKNIFGGWDCETIWAPRKICETCTGTIVDASGRIKREIKERWEQIQRCTEDRTRYEDVCICGCPIGS